jgi:HD superfamily phosphohydrolase
VYPSAVHTRFEHSIGVLQVTDRIAQNLGFDENRKRKVRIAALLHDVGHGPFSHLFEEAIARINGKQFSHETVTRWIVEEDDTVHSVLGGLAEEVVDILSPRTDSCKDTLSADIISSGVDADKLDYLRRDSYHVGVAYGSFDLERILHTVDVTPDEENLCVQEKGKDAIENYRLGRYLMHSQVYEHHTRLIADQMFLRAVELAFDSGILDKNALKVINPRHGGHVSHKRFLNYYLQLTDSSVYQTILEERHSEAAKILRAVTERRLLKRAYEVDLGIDIRDAIKRRDLSNMPRSEVAELEKVVARDAGLNPVNVIFHRSTISIKLFEPYDILILRPSKEVRTLDEMSPISADTSPIERIFVFCPKDKKSRVRRAAKKHLGV